ncbi:hypothetical protein JTB14_037735 [Gonioctena quinquepunctata]|nr:hypothetical protein JTB14_037735 [Gonioctena quinquepunctata]
MLSLTEEDKITVTNYLKDLSCCSRCITRFLGIKCSNEFPDTYLRPQDFVEVKEENDPDVKKVKTNPCRACLNVLEDQSIEKYFSKLSSEETDKYKYPTYQLVISFPITMLLREHSMFLHLKEKFPNIYTESNDVEGVKKIFRVVSNALLTDRISKNSHPKSNFMININIHYEDDKKDIEKLKKSYKNISRHILGEIIDDLTDETFKSHFPVPPTIPDKEASAEITLNSEAMYLGGRYLKFSRDMGQTPWIINDNSMTEHCLMDVIFDSVVKVLGFDRTKMIFSASGREDADTRMLGNGRPFYIQVQDPTADEISFEQFREIEAYILKTNVAAVLKLQKVSRNSVKQIKEGEEFKKKHYLALCKALAPNVEEVIKAINTYHSDQPLEINQKTPLRVLHRRTLSVRKKIIYFMKASPVPGHPDFFSLELITQAGTYVKEFVHGDFQRTQPNLSSLFKYPMDVVALDVTKVDLDWP